MCKRFFLLLVWFWVFLIINDVELLSEVYSQFCCIFLKCVFGCFSSSQWNGNGNDTSASRTDIQNLSMLIHPAAFPFWKLRWGPEHNFAKEGLKILSWIIVWNKVLPHIHLSLPSLTSVRAHTHTHTHYYHRPRPLRLHWNMRITTFNAVSTWMPKFPFSQPTPHSPNSFMVKYNGYILPYVTSLVKTKQF